MIKLCVTIFVMLVAPILAFGQDQRRTFTLSDTIFPIGSVYTGCQILDSEKGSVLIRPEHQPCLDSVADLILRNPWMIIEVGCHTDQRGSDTFNLRLSRDRAGRIVNYLISLGVPDYRIVAVGYGERRPIYSQSEINKLTDKNEQKKRYAANRRTEFRIISRYRNMTVWGDTLLEPGVLIRCPIRYKLAHDEIDSSSYSFLDSLAAFLVAHPLVQIQIEVHLDSRASPYSSRRLSSERGFSVYDYLRAHGVSQTQMLVKSYEGTNPMIPDYIINEAPTKAEQEKMHAINRRTEIRILKVN